jgi:hypothetical protein
MMKGGGPIGEFLYEVGEMKIGSQMGKLMVDEMVGSWSCRGAGKKEHNHRVMSWESIWETRKMRRRSMWLICNMMKDYRESHP